MMVRMKVNKHHLLFYKELLKFVSRHVKVLFNFQTYTMAKDDNDITRKKDLKIFATKKDLKNLEKSILHQVGEMLSGVISYIDKKHDETFQYIDKKHKETMHQFHIISEDTKHDAMGTKKDEISVMKDKQKNHGSRIKRLEHHTGLIAA